MRKLLSIFLVILLLIIGGCSPNINTPESNNQNTEDSVLMWLRNITWLGDLDSFPQDPEEGDAFYNISTGCSYIFSAQSGWMQVAKSGPGFKWLGEYDYFPCQDLSIGSAFYHTSLRSSYMYDGNDWRLLAKSGNNSNNTPIYWLGDYSTAPLDPSEGVAYHDTSLKKSFIYSNNEWHTLSVDGSNMYWMGEFDTEPSNPILYSAYFNTIQNTAYIWNGEKWDLLSTSTNPTYILPIKWKGNLEAAPEDPSIGWMYYNTVYKKTYMWDGICWETIASDGISPIGLLITWKGPSEKDPESPEKGWCYYNTKDNASYIFDGKNWNIIARGAQEGGNSYISNAKLAISVDGDDYNNPYTLKLSLDDYMKPSTHQITIKNTGNETVYLCDPDGVLVVNTYDPFCSSFVDFTNYKTCLNPDESCSIDVSFTPKKSSTLIDYRGVTINIYNTTVISPLYIQLSYSSNYNSGGVYFTYTKYATREKCHHLSYNILYGNMELDFATTILDSNDSINYSLSISNNSESAIDLPADFAWIDGENANCFKIQPKLNNVRLTPDNNITLLDVIFSPDSIGYKSAVLHLGTGINNPNLTVSLKGLAAQSHTDFDGKDYITYKSPIDIDYSKYPRLVGGEEGRFFAIHSNESSSHPFTSVSEYDKDGNLIESSIFELYTTPQYAIRIGNTIRIYTFRTEYYDYDIETKEISIKKTCTSDEYYLNNPTEKSGNTYSKIFPYEEYSICLSINNYADIYRGDDLWTTVSSLFDVPNYNYDTCISGDYLYWMTDCLIGRINIKEIIEDLEVVF